MLLYDRGEGTGRQRKNIITFNVSDGKGHTPILFLFLGHMPKTAVRGRVTKKALPVTWQHMGISLLQKRGMQIGGATIK